MQSFGAFGHLTENVTQLSNTMQTRFIFGALLLCLQFTLISPLFAQQQAQSADHEIVFQRDDKEKTVQVGNHVSYKIYGSFRGFEGYIEDIGPDYIVVNRHTIELDDIRRLTAMPENAHRMSWAFLIGGLACLALAASGLIGLIYWAFFSSGNIQQDSLRIRKIYRNTMISGFLMYFLGFFVYMFKRKVFRFRKWKVSVRKQKE